MRLAALLMTAALAVPVMAVPLMAGNGEPVPAPLTVKVKVSGLETPRMVKVPGTSKVVGPVCTIFVDLNVMTGSSETSKKSLLFSLSSFMPLPLSTDAAWI